MDKRNLIIGILSLVVLTLGYFTFSSRNKMIEQSNLIKAATDSVHTFKTTIGNQGAYISTLVGTKQELENILSVKSKQNQAYALIIDSLKKASVQSAAVVTTNTSISHQDSSSKYKGIELTDTIRSKFYTADINVHNSILDFKYVGIDQLMLTNSLKPNKGLFSGSTLTTYATSINPDTKVTGVTSVSTVVNKPKLHIGPSATVGLNSDLHGKQVRLGYQIGIGIQF